MCLFTVYLLPFIRKKYSLPNRRRFSSPSSLLSSFPFLDRWWQLSGVIRNTWIRGKKATFLDDGQLCLATINYTKIIDRRTLGRLIQVNGAFYSIKKSRVIKSFLLTQHSLLFLHSSLILSHFLLSNNRDGSETCLLPPAPARTGSERWASLMLLDESPCLSCNNRR